MPLVRSHPHSWALANLAYLSSFSIFLEHWVVFVARQDLSYYDNDCSDSSCKLSECLLLLFFEDDGLLAVPVRVLDGCLVI